MNKSALAYIPENIKEDINITEYDIKKDWKIVRYNIKKLNNNENLMK